MGLKDMVRKDIRNVFFNLEEFGEEHTIDGREMAVIIDDNELVEREKKTKTLAEGLHVKQLLVYVSAEIYGEPPLINRMMELDGDFYTVTDVEDEDGIYAISLEANES